jgi:OmpA-OmpF porin, OOP family
MTMLRKMMFAAVAVGLYASAALAQDATYDDRFYVAPYVGGVFTDSKRDAENAAILGLGFGKFLTERFSLEGEINRFDSDLELTDGSWQVTGFGATGRLFFGGDGWRPYALLGLGTARSDRDGSPKDSGFDFKTGLGVQNPFTDNVSARMEAVYRFNQDDNSLIGEDDYSDFGVNFGLAVALGERTAMAPVSPEAEALGEPKVDTMEAAPAEAPAELPMDDDDDQDGVKNDIDKCPTTPAGEMVQKSDGCPVQEVIDLRGVNFDFDKCNLRPDAITILNNAVDVLKNHDIRVSVEGHTDSMGTDAYNEKLSDCRAKVVLDYLGNNGVPADKITGSKGWGESKPIDTNESAEGRARNRRTELVRQN